MDWDKANFKKINQRKEESKRWKKQDDARSEEPAKKGLNRQPSKKNKRKKK